MRRFAPLVALALVCITPTLDGCWAQQAYAQRRAIEQAKFSLRNVQLLGVDLVGVNLLVTMQLENPTETDIVLDRLEYSLSVNGIKAFDGGVKERLSVPAAQTRPLPIQISLAYADLSSQVRGLLVSRQVSSWKVVGVAHFDTPVGTIDYPIAVERGR